MDRVDELKEILAQDPNAAFPRYGLAMEYRQRGELELALNEFDELEKCHPDYTAGYQMAAQLLMEAGRMIEAEARLRKGIESARHTRNQHALAELEGMLDELERS